MPDADKNSEQWPAEARLAAIVATATLSEVGAVRASYSPTDLPASR